MEARDFEMETRDFTLDAYRLLLRAITASGYECITFREYCESRAENGTAESSQQVILRHDVDRQARNALRMAAAEAEHNIRATYFFRIVPSAFKRDIIRATASLGHEVGYHYEDLSLAHGDYAKAIALFEEHLGWFEGLAPVSTICMHGSPLSPWDNRALWERYDYKDYGLLGEPYLVMDFEKWFYLTDTGMHWNGSEVSIRDKVGSSFELDFGSTEAIVQAFARGEMPDHVMINTHPERWHANALAWGAEYVKQSCKNVIKRGVVWWKE